MHKKRVVSSALGLIVILVAIVLVFSLLKGKPDVGPMVKDVIELRQANDSVKKAGKIAKIDGYVEKLDNEEISDGWTTLILCLKEQCSDDDYFNLLFIVFSEKNDEIEHSDILLEAIKVNRYWGSEEVVEFSKSLSFVNEAVEKLDNRDVEKKWDEIIACNNVCENKNNLFFELTEKIMQS